MKKKKYQRHLENQFILRLKLCVLREDSSQTQELTVQNYFVIRKKMNEKVTTSFMAHEQWNIHFVKHFVVNLLAFPCQQLMAVPIFSLKKQQFEK